MKRVKNDGFFQKFRKLIFLEKIFKNFFFGKKLPFKFTEKINFIGDEFFENPLQGNKSNFSLIQAAVKKPRFFRVLKKRAKFKMILLFISLNKSNEMTKVSSKKRVRIYLFAFTKALLRYLNPIQKNLRRGIQRSGDYPLRDFISENSQTDHLALKKPIVQSVTITLSFEDCFTRDFKKN